MRFSLPCAVNYVIFTPETHNHLAILLFIVYG